jgi:hypothetical protein
MESLQEFCWRLHLDPEEPDAKLHYQQWCDAYARLMMLGGL